MREENIFSIHIHLIILIYILLVKIIYYLKDSIIYIIGLVINDMNGIIQQI